MSRPRSELTPYAWGQFSVDYEQRGDQHRQREAHLHATRTAMREAGVDALLLWKTENVRFLTGLRAQIISGKSALLNGCLLTNDRVTLLLSGGEVDRARSTMPWIDDICPIPIMEQRDLVLGTFKHTIAPLFAKLDLDRGTAGFDEIAYAQLEALRELLPHVQLADGDALMHSVRMIKTEEDLIQMQEVAAIAEGVTQAAIDAVRPGIREIDVVAEAMHALYRLGGETPHVATPFVASGEHMSPPHRFATDKIIRNGDLVFIDIGAMFNGLYADMGRTVICGTPNRTQKEIYTAVLHALRAGTEALKSGNSNDDVAGAVRAEGERWGYGDRFLSLFIGHGVGFGSNEPPYVGETSPGAPTTRLVENMVIALEPLIWVPGVPGGAGVRLEDTIAVGPDGGLPLTRTAFDEQLILG